LCFIGVLLIRLAAMFALPPITTEKADIDDVS